MISRKNYCKSIINEAMMEYNVSTPEKLIPFISQSSIMGRALQELGIRNGHDTPDEDRYINTRGGIMKTFAEKNGDEEPHIEILTFREFLNLLPEEVKED